MSSEEDELGIWVSSTVTLALLGLGAGSSTYLVSSTSTIRGSWDCSVGGAEPESSF
jgi:hypothetical protein